jgi:hypothetical protein
MRFLESLVLSLWAGFLAANVAILASALPYIYTKEDPMRCGSLGLTRFVIDMIPEFIGVIILLGVCCYSGRACISAIRWRRVPIVRWILKPAVIVGGGLWFAGAFSGAAVFALFLTVLTNMLRNPPPLPTNLSDVKACSEFIIINTKPSDYGPDWLK